MIFSKMKLLSSFYNKHKGEACYIFGNGPSIKWFDIGLFNDLISISVGKLHYHNDFNKINVKYMVLPEPWFFVNRDLRKYFMSKKRAKYFDECRPIADDYLDFIKYNQDKHFFINLSNLLSVRENNISYVNKELPRSISKMNDIFRGHNAFSGSFIAPLALAHYMGFSTVYLVGFDAWTINPVRNIRYYEKGEGVEGSNNPGELSWLKLLQNEMNVRAIIPSGESVGVESILYKEYTGFDPEYRENVEIVQKRYLEMLSTISAFDI